jgi:DNA-directed RNA polymerase subunit N (RpoN/RPB10)
MLVLPTACFSCGNNIGAITLLFKYLIYRYPRYRREAMRVGEGRETLLAEVSEQCGVINPCCWNMLQGMMTYTDVGVPARICTSSGAYLFGGE